jgi:hypothetical protein
MYLAVEIVERVITSKRLADILKLRPQATDKDAFLAGIWRELRMSATPTQIALRFPGDHIIGLDA